MSAPSYHRTSAAELGSRVARRITRTTPDSPYNEIVATGASSLQCAVEAIAQWASRHHADDMAALHAVVREIERTIIEGPLALASPAPGTPEPRTLTGPAVGGTVDERAPW